MGGAVRIRPAVHSRPDPSTVRIDGPWAHRDVYANGIRMHVAETGEGPLVLMLHGFCEFWWSWRHQLTAIGDAGFRAVAVDLRGYGDSDKPPRGYDAWTLSGDVAGLIKSLGERQAHLIGHGWGGLLAWSVAAMHPRLVHTVCALAAPHPLALRRQVRRTLLHGKRTNQARALGHLFRAQLPIAPERWLAGDGAAEVGAALRRWSGPDWTARPEFAEAVIRHQAAMMVPGAAHCALEYLRWAVRSQIRSEGRRFTEVLRRRIDLPVLQLRGSADHCMLPGSVQASDRWLSGPGTSVSLAGVGHYLNQEAPAATNQVLRTFLTGVQHIR